MHDKFCRVIKNIVSNIQYVYKPFVLKPKNDGEYEPITDAG